uniref:Uncharacterized protein n=1 Tax=viral metagenome TaxID=1070528 RepID=A0A6C0I858_9ZZZZ
MSALLETENQYKRHEPLSDDDIEIVEKIISRIDHTIYRFKFTGDFMEELYKFSKIHQYDHRKDFKEAWTKWTEENSDIISNETERLLALGYKNEDNIDDKMFKSARYYFRKKSPVKPEPKQRRQYISVDQELLSAIDRHIVVNNECKPETAFIMFCKENEEILRQSIGQIFTQGINDTQLIQAKIKKTYKNRYFLLVKQSNK